MGTSLMVLCFISGRCEMCSGEIYNTLYNSLVYILGEFIILHDANVIKYKMEIYI